MADAIIQEFIQERQNLGLGSDADGKNRIFLGSVLVRKKVQPSASFAPENARRD